MTEAEKHLISAWKYTGEYALYNTPPYEEDLKTKGIIRTAFGENLAGYVITGEPFKQTTGLGEGTFYRMVFSN